MQTNTKHLEKEARLPNSTYPKGGVSCCKESLVVNPTLVFQIMFCGKSPALRVDANLYSQFQKTPKTMEYQDIITNFLTSTFIVGLATYFIRKRIDKRFNKIEEFQKTLITIRKEHYDTLLKT